MKGGTRYLKLFLSPNPENSVIGNFEYADSSSPGLGYINPVLAVNVDFIRGNERAGVPATGTELTQEVEVIIVDHNGALQFIDHDNIAGLISNDTRHNVKSPRSSTGLA